MAGRTAGSESNSILLYSTDSETLGRQLATAWDRVSSVWRSNARWASRSGLLLYVVDKASIRLCARTGEAVANPSTSEHAAAAQASLKWDRICMELPSYAWTLSLPEPQWVVPTTDRTRTI